MNVDNKPMDYEAAGSLAEELPWWGWLEDGRICLTRAGEFMSIGRLTPSVLDGQTPEQLDRVIDRWQRMLSGLDPRTRFYFYLLRRPVHFANDSAGAGAPSSVAALGRRKRRAFLSKRVQDVSAYVAWCHDPHLAAVAQGPTEGPWWRATARNWMARRRNPQLSVYLQSSIESAAAGFRQLVDASRALVDDLTPVRVLEAREASLVLNELTNRPGTFWEGATGSGMNWRLAVSELEAERRHLRLDGEPIILYSLLSPPGSARRQSSGGSLPARCHNDGGARMAAAAPRCRPPQDSRGAAALLLEALLHGGSRSGNRRDCVRDGGHGGGSGIRSPWRCPGRA